MVGKIEYNYLLIILAEVRFFTSSCIHWCALSVRIRFWLCSQSNKFTHIWLSRLSHKNTFWKQSRKIVCGSEFQLGPVDWCLTGFIIRRESQDMLKYYCNFSRGLTYSAFATREAELPSRIHNFSVDLARDQLQNLQTWLRWNWILKFVIPR